jgi:hypothetical protein
VRADEKMQLELAIDIPFCIAPQLVRLLKGEGGGQCMTDSNGAMKFVFLF